MPSKSAASWKLSKRVNQKLFWKASNCQLCCTASQHHKRSCGQRWPLPPPCCLVGKVHTLLTNSHHWRSQQDTSRRWHQCPSLGGVQAKQKKMEILSKSEWQHAAVLACMCHSFLDVCIGMYLHQDWCPAQRNLPLRSLDSNPDCNCTICWARTWQAKWAGICYPSHNLAAIGDRHFSVSQNRDCNIFLIFLRLVRL